MPRRVSHDVQRFREMLVEGVLLVAGNAEGIIGTDVDDPVFVAIVADVQGIGRNPAAIYALQASGLIPVTRHRANADTALQGAFEALEEWTLDNYPEHFEELEREYGDRATDILTSTFNGWVWELDPREYADALTMKAIEFTGEPDEEEF